MCERGCSTYFHVLLLFLVIEYEIRLFFSGLIFILIMHTFRILLHFPRFPTMKWHHNVALDYLLKCYVLLEMTPLWPFFFSFFFWRVDIFYLLPPLHILFRAEYFWFARYWRRKCGKMIRFGIENLLSLTWFGYGGI